MTTTHSHRIFYSIQPSSFGFYLIAVMDCRIVALHFVNQSDQISPAEIIRTQWPETECIESSFETENITSSFMQDFLKKQFSSYPLMLCGTPFQKRVWEALMAIPFGTTVSYAAVAAMIGRPTAVRAVAGAISKNSIALLIPCHRVVCSNNTIGGYKWGIMRKKALIEWERAY